jgi:hypothetical protein
LQSVLRETRFAALIGGEMTDLASGEAQAPQKLRVTGVIGATFASLRGSFARLFLFTLVFGVVPSGLIMFVVYSLVLNQIITNNGDINQLQLVSRIIAVIADIPQHAGAGAATLCAVSWLDGNRASMGACTRRAGAVFLPLLLLYALIYLACVLGAVLLIIPGIFIATLVAAAPSAVAIERMGILDALRRSASLTEGNRWRVLFLLAAGLGVNVAIGRLYALALQGVILAAGGQYASVALFTVIPGAVIGTIPIMIMDVGLAAIYHGLRTAKEGPASRTLAEVFD